MQNRYLFYTATNRLSLWRKAVAVITSTVLVVLVLMFSAVFFVVIFIVGALGWAYLWWRTRELRKQMRNFPPRGASMENEVFTGEVIEGEVIRVDELRDRIGR